MIEGLAENIFRMAPVINLFLSVHIFRATTVRKKKQKTTTQVFLLLQKLTLRADKFKHGALHCFHLPILQETSIYFSSL